MENKVTKDLLAIEAVQLKVDNYFTWTSGLKSPIYCDNRLTMSYPAVRKNIVKAFAEMVKNSDTKPEVIAGCATAGIPHAAWLAEELELPMVYVRSKPKGHGKGNQIEGASVEGKKVLVIEDLISTGGSSIQSAQALEQEGAEITAVYSIFTYGLPRAEEAFAEAGLSYQSITGFDQLLELLIEENKLTETEKETVLAWRSEL
ncbi:orotate phosphoribosyltransferase [Oceanobacillus neutriphilus]|uniref:Orotate phosphoribosyltransferase n=1 Tax=Oceanobacillus neutriphilus TaxID=531815 RepID=A0ABQ2P1C8_9BACI|nr:orotate phosphoribosyltransferase [Oceanobacillus neutriphilus]GGP15683.1 orotate phosphoribosyltransferase [Oceanobacillus neutriphilus]